MSVHGLVTVGLSPGVRVFQSCPAANSLNFIGGPAILLGLIAMARDDHAMYAAVKVLNSVLNRSPMSEKLMSHIGGYQVRMSPSGFRCCLPHLHYVFSASLRAWPKGHCS